MAGRITKSDLQNLHGQDVEIIEMDGDDEPTGRRFKVVQPPTPPGPLAHWPLWQRLGLGVPVLSLLIVIMIVGAAATIAALWLLWLIVSSLFH